jgi:ATP-dependent DNA ligase
MLPAPMLARTGRLPEKSGYAYALKWDGFRAVVRAGRDFCVRSRRGWNMTPLPPEPAVRPVDAVLDGELAHSATTAGHIFRAHSRAPLRGLKAPAPPSQTRMASRFAQ